MLIHRLRQPARSKEQGNSFAGGQGADLHRCLHRERTATSTPSRLTFAVNKIRACPRLLCFESCPPSADLYFGYLNLSASGGFVSDLEFMASAIPYGRISDLPCYLSPPKVKKCKKSVQNMLKTCSFLLIFA